MGWKNPFEKRAFVNPKTGEPAIRLVRGEHGEVIGTATSSDEVNEVITKDNDGLREAA